MKKGQRPSRHIRRVKTKKGKKKVLVNPTIKKKKRKSYAAIEPISEEEFERLRRKGKLIFDLRDEREKLKEMVQRLSKEDIIRINPEGTLSSFAKRIGLNPTSSKDLGMAEQLLKSKGFTIKPRAVIREKVAPSVKPPKDSLKRIKERLVELARIKREREELARKEEPVGEFLTVDEIRRRMGLPKLKISKKKEEALVEAEIRRKFPTLRVSPKRREVESERSRRLRFPKKFYQKKKFKERLKRKSRLKRKR